MKPETKNLIIGFLSAVSIVVFVSCVGAAIGHADGPSAQDVKWMDAIKANQNVLANDRDGYNRVTTAVSQVFAFDPKDVAAYNEFVKTKADNAYKVAALNKDGWTVDWKTLTLVPSFQ